MAKHDLNISEVYTNIANRCEYSKATNTRKIFRSRAPLVFDLEFATRKVRVPSAKAMFLHFELKGFAPPLVVDSFMHGFVVAIQVENFGLPKRAMSREGQTSKISKNWVSVLFSHPGI